MGVVVVEAESDEDGDGVNELVGEVDPEGVRDGVTDDVVEGELVREGDPETVREIEMGRIYSTCTPELPPLHTPLPAPPLKAGAPFRGVGKPSATEPVPHTTTPPAPAPEQ